MQTGKGTVRYASVVSALEKLEKTTLKGRKEYINHIGGLVTALESLADEYANIGHNKLAQAIVVVRNKMLVLKRQLEAGKVSSVSAIKKAAKESLASMTNFSPEKADSFHEKAGLKQGLGKLFSEFKKKRVKLSTEEGKSFSLERAPLLLLFKGPLSKTTEKLLKKFNATFYPGTGGVSIPSIPILVFNRNIISERDYDRAIKQVLSLIYRPDLAVFKDQAVVKRNYVAFPVFEPQDANLFSAVFFNQTRSMELWVS